MINYIYASFGAFTVVMFQVEAFRVVTPCSVMVGYQRFGGPCHNQEDLDLKLYLIHNFQVLL